MTESIRASLVHALQMRAEECRTQFFNVAKESDEVTIHALRGKSEAYYHAIAIINSSVTWPPCADCRDAETAARKLGWNGLPDEHPDTHGNAVDWMRREILKNREQAKEEEEEEEEDYGPPAPTPITRHYVIPPERITHSVARPIVIEEDESGVPRCHRRVVSENSAEADVLAELERLRHFVKWVADPDCPLPVDVREGEDPLVAVKRAARKHLS